MKKLFFCLMLGLAAPVLSQAQQVTDATGRSVYTVVEQMPEYPGGNDALIQYLAANITYPKAAKDAKQQGRVVMRFVVDEHGEVGSVEVMRGLGPELDAEATRVISNMPRWKPGMQDGKAVPVYMTLPITFKLENNKPAPRK